MSTQDFQDYLTHLENEGRHDSDGTFTDPNAPAVLHSEGHLGTDPILFDDVTVSEDANALVLAGKGVMGSAPIAQHHQFSYAPKP